MKPAHERLTASLADRYTIERELGQGGMATVYLQEAQVVPIVVTENWFDELRRMVGGR